MNFGTYDLQKMIYEQLVRGQVEVRMNGGRGKFSKDLAKKIHDFIEENMNTDMQMTALMRGFSRDVIAAHERVCKVFDFASMPLKSQNDADVYLWIIEREKNGQNLETFCAWAKSPERVQYFRKYAKDTQNIKLDWLQAFTPANHSNDEMIGVS